MIGRAVKGRAMRGGLVLPALAVIGLVAGGAVWRNRSEPASVAGPELVHLAGGPVRYRPPGEFRIGTQVMDPPVLQSVAPGIDIMAYQVSVADYAVCVADRVCAALRGQGQADQPRTGVSFVDATTYAAWLSDQTGQVWRLPTDAEWLRAAGDRAPAEAVLTSTGDDDPSRRWLDSYRQDAALRGATDPIIHPLGHFGLNDQGVADIAGNVWEWTATCFQNGTLGADGQSIATAVDHCGVRAVQGRHRTYVIDFIRDARSGGCGVGLPPDFLGFRLVRDAGQS